MTSVAMGAAQAPVRKGGLGFWLGGLIACVLAVLWATVASIGITFPTAETASPDPTQSLAFQVGAVSRAPLMVSAVIWALCGTIFWRLASVRSALLGLAILLVASFAVAIPIRLSLASSLTGDDLVAVTFVQSTTSQVEEIVSGAREQAEEIGFSSDAPQSAWTRDFIETRRLHLEQALPIARNAMERLESARQTSITAIAELDVSETTRNHITSQLEWVIGPSPSVVEAFRSELLVVEKSEEQFSYLGANAPGWDVEEGQIAFRSERVYRRYNQLGEELNMLAAAMNATTQAMRAKRQATLAASPFDTTPKLFESLAPSSVGQVKRIASWSYLILLRAMMSIVGAALFALLAAPIIKLSAANISWARIGAVAWRSFLPALLGISLTYAAYVDILGRASYETPALLLTAWLVLAGWLISRGMKQEGIVRRFPGIGTRVIVGLFALSWLIAGIVYVFALVTGQL